MELYYALIKKKSRLQKGFTLVELVVTTAILVSVLSFSLLGFISCFILNENNRNLIIASSLAQYVMEEIKATDFTGIKSNIDSGGWDWNTSDITTRGINALKNETIDTAVTGTSLLNITVTVTWQDRDLRNQSFILETINAQP